MRGDHAVYQPVGAGPRSTPTCVGTTGSTRSEVILHGTTPHAWGPSTTSQNRSHERSTPHAWGHCARYGSAHCEGLPPHAWGPPTVEQGAEGLARSTPTCVGTTPVEPMMRPRCQVYPHMRGDHVVTADDDPRKAGLPPHAWGPRAVRAGGCRQPGSTPTCVGTTASGPLDHELDMVYPHMRGDHFLPSFYRQPSLGLPPHAWGPPLPALVHDAQNGSTPTCVGTTRRTARPPARPKVYPHMRGDHGVLQASFQFLAGLPPHAWGPLPGAGDRRGVTGSTPTCVGTTPSARHPTPSRAVYPHMRGDHCTSTPSAGGATGLPPHAWGPRRTALAFGDRLRSTPTCVGTTSKASMMPSHCGSTPTCVGTTGRRQSARCARRVYPHMRGDHPCQPFDVAVSAGLPPHAWGPPVRHHTVGPSRGSTPTCVGTTADEQDVCRCFPVYPHMRGDHLPGDAKGDDLLGLPPHAWGPRCRSADLPIIYGSTPTCVGTTDRGSNHG